MKRRFPALVLLAACLTAGENRVGRVQVFVAPERAGWKYAPGEKAVFVIRALRDGAPATGCRLTWSAGPEMLPPVRSGTVALTGEDVRVDGGALDRPGFLRLEAIVEDGARRYRAVGTAAFSPEDIRPAVGEPRDFDAFWQAGRAALSALPIDARRTPLPDRGTATLDAYEVSLQNVGPGAKGASRLFGILTEPKAPGRYPALLRLPSAGVYGAADLVKDDYDRTLILTIGIHGVPLTLDPGVYHLLGAGALKGYWDFHLDSKEEYYYRRVYLGCLRAVDYLASLPNWDGKDHRRNRRQPGRRPVHSRRRAGPPREGPGRLPPGAGRHGRIRRGARRRLAQPVPRPRLAHAREAGDGGVLRRGELRAARESARHLLVGLQ